MTGILYVVGTPIGNLSDLTHRAEYTLKSVDLIAAEDTRVSRKLLNHYDINVPLISYHDKNEKFQANKLVGRLMLGENIALISDAGTPTISDPGMILVKKCIQENLFVFPVPGPSAVTSAVSASGFSDKYLFYGFLVKKEKELEKILNSLSNIDYSLVFFIPASKINFYINHFKKYFLDRKIVIAREMTKIHEEFIRSKVELIKNLPQNIKGELTVVLSEKKKEKKIKKEITESVKIEIRKMIKKYSHKDVVQFISKKENLPKKIIYEYCLKLKKLK